MPVAERRTQQSPSSEAPTQESEPAWLPDFCTMRVLFVLMVVSELVALVVVIAPGHVSAPTWQRLGVASLFVQWLAVVWTVCLCKTRPWLLHLAPWMGEFVAYGIMVAITAIASWVVFRIDHALNFGLIADEADVFRFVLRNSVICGLIAGAVLRYFYVQEQWRQRERAEALARFEALQARIRPHFLFNSMNTIASLIRTRPASAETAVEDLADLFRAALTREGGTRSLGEELDLARGYLRIEQLRLGERLQLHWQVDALPRALQLPPLLLQPLVENAVYHGIQPLPQGGLVSVVGERLDGRLRITISNPRPRLSSRPPGGNGMAVANIRARVEYHFGSRGALDIEAHDESYVCTLILPDASPSELIEK